MEKVDWRFRIGQVFYIIILYHYIYYVLYLEFLYCCIIKWLLLLLFVFVVVVTAKVHDFLENKLEKSFEFQVAFFIIYLFWQFFYFYF